MTRSSEESANLREIVKRLDALINILLITSVPKQDGLTVARKVQILDAAGLRPAEIAEILGITISHVSAQLSRQKKKGAHSRKE